MDWGSDGAIAEVKVADLYFLMTSQNQDVGRSGYVGMGYSSGLNC